MGSLIDKIEAMARLGASLGCIADACADLELHELQQIARRLLQEGLVPSPLSGQSMRWDNYSENVLIDYLFKAAP